MARISWKAIALGIATDLGLTNLLLLPVASGILVSPGVQALPEAARTEAWLSVLTTSPKMYALGLVLGGLASACGGWVAATVARREELVHGALSALGCVGLGIYAWSTGASVATTATHLAFLVLSPVLGAFGAIVQRVGRRRALARAESPSVRPRGAWMVLTLDYAMLVVCAFVTIVYVTLGMLGQTGAGDFPLTTLIVATGYGVFLFALYAFAAHAMRIGHVYRWRAHAMAVGLTLLPVLPTLLLR